MPRRPVFLSVTERDQLLALPDAEDGLIRHYTFSERDLSIIGQHRGVPIGWVSPFSFATCDFPESS